MLLLSAPKIAGLLPAPIEAKVEAPLKSPYPYFGGKATVARVVWERLGDTPNYVEPFFGSGAVLLSRPAEHLQRPRTETVNDADCMVSNFWRAVRYNAEAVAEYADYPVNENDLHARHAWLVGKKPSLRALVEGDPEYFDAKIAGWWVWGMSCWIGGGFCDGSGPWHVVDGELIDLRKTSGQAVYGKRPDLHHHGAGVVADDPGTMRKLPRRGGAAGTVAAAGRQRRRPQLHNEMGVNADNRGTGVAWQLPYLRGEQGVSRISESEKGIARQSPRLSGDQGVVRQMPELKSLRGDTAQRTSRLMPYFEQLQARLRRVRVCSGDWSRIVGPAVTTGNGLTAVFLDPPYTHDSRDTSLYVEDAAHLVSEVRTWAIANGDNPQMRIAYCGYEDGFEWPAGWTAYRWTANGGYGNQGNGRGAENKKREVIWFSPHCVPEEVGPVQMSLFA